MELLTVDETARMLRVSPITIRRYIASGRLAAERIGRGVRVRRDAVDRLLTPISPHSVNSASSRSLGKPFTRNDPLWEIVGIARSDEPTDVAENTDKYLAEAYLAKHE